MAVGDSKGHSFIDETQQRYVLHPGWLKPNRYVGEAELRRVHEIPDKAIVVVLDGHNRRKFYGLPGDVHLFPESIEKGRFDVRPDR